MSASTLHVATPTPAAGGLAGVAEAVTAAEAASTLGLAGWPRVAGALSVAGWRAGVWLLSGTPLWARYALVLVAAAGLATGHWVPR